MLNPKLSDKKTKGVLYLIPTAIGSMPAIDCLPQTVIEITHSLDEFIVENSKSARQFLKHINIPTPQQQLIIHELNKHEGNVFETSFFSNLLSGKNVGLLSEAGCPAVADPGALIVAEAHKLQIKVVPLTGPSSILLALMASGLNGQQFAFNGYLPKEKTERIAAIKKAEKDSAQGRQTQIFIETPYRNNALFDDLLNYLQPSTRLCIAAALQCENEMIKTQRVSEWKKQRQELNKHPVVWLFLA
ncbi:MAG TPA: SAM-dependent methyltransferase [Bacteroidia bacterium]|nr:SAM-dependent methyltransferase [Bacteroidia bacterium]